MLLWLQRDYMFEMFETKPALAGMDEETPYGFDHILPSAQWASWTGVRGDNKFIDFPLKSSDGTIQDDSGYWHIGHSLGNIHVLDSGMNRSLGDTSVSAKLKMQKFADNAQILDSHQAEWLKASGNEKPRVWNLIRALAFQRAVERRTFALYCKFYADLFPSNKKCNEPLVGQINSAKLVA